MFVASRSSKLLVSAGHWDNSFRVESPEKGKIIARVAYHQGKGDMLHKVKGEVELSDG